MNGRERFGTALRLGQPDRVPLYDFFDERSTVKMGQFLGKNTPRLANPLTYTPDEVSAAFNLLLDLVRDLDLDAIAMELSLGMELAQDGKTARDRFGILYLVNDHGESFPVDGPVRDRETLLKCRDALTPRPTDTDVIAVAREQLPDRAVVVYVPGPFGTGWRLMGSMEKYLLQLVLNPDLCLELNRALTDFIVAEVQQAISAGADVVVLEGDLAANLQPFISPAHYRRFLQPFHREIVEVAHSDGVPVIKHSDGNLWPILEDLLAAGFDGINPIQPQCMDIAEAKLYLSGRACAVGNIDCVELLPYGKAEEVVATVRETIHIAAPGGGYILTSSNSIHPDCDPKNVIAMFSAAHKYGTYPLR